MREALILEAKEGIDVVIDYLWGRPTELAVRLSRRLSSPARQNPRGLSRSGRALAAPSRLRVPYCAVWTLSCSAVVSAAVPLDSILTAIPELFRLAAAGKLRVDVEAVPLAEVEVAWNRVEKGRRIVFTTGKL